jgi:ankyrin repeat protein
MVERAGYKNVNEYLEKEGLVHEGWKLCSWNSKIVKTLILFNRVDLLEIFSMIADPSHINDRNTTPDCTYIPNKGPGEPAIIYAISVGNLETVEFLLAKGADINAMNAKGKTAIMGAISWGNLEMVKLLVAKKVNVNMKSLDDMTPLSYALRKDQTKIVDYLLSVGSEENVKEIEIRNLTSKNSFV